jgi:fused signal recognition particle receptor
MLTALRSLRDGLARSRKQLADRVGSLILGQKVSEEQLLELEEALIASDVGAAAAHAVLEELQQQFKRKELTTAEEVRDRLKSILTGLLAGHSANLSLAASPAVILVVGVNGAGKTTTIGKLAHRLQGEGKKVMLAAADTFRAAASEQLEIWGERVGIPVIRHKEGADPGAVAFDAVTAAKARGIDVLLVDTAGRLHTKSNLMEELRKVKRIIARELPGAPHEVLLVLDGSTGQNALAQAKIFLEVAGVTGIVLTKLDGTPKGGIVFSIVKDLAIPVKFVGIGEAIDDLRRFDPHEFVDALL